MSIADLQPQIDSLSLAELQELRSMLDQKIEARAKQERTELIEKMEALAKEKGFGSLNALLGETAPQQSKGKRKTILPPKYRNPADPNQTWTGRGRRPRWIEDMLAAGGSLDDALIDT